MSKVEIKKMGQRSKNRIQEKDIEDNEEMKKGGIAIRKDLTPTQNAAQKIPLSVFYYGTVKSVRLVWITLSL